jgi:hypothetical protein
VVLRRCWALVSLAVLAGCGGASGASPTASGTATPIATAAPPTATATPTPIPTATPVSETGVSGLAAVAALTFPPCANESCPAAGTRFTTCDDGLTATLPSPTNRFSLCPFTARLANQLAADAQGGDAGGGPADPVGGGQDPEWPSESITAVASATGGIAEVTFVDGANTFKTDLVIVESGGDLLVDDIYCAGTKPATTDAYAAGWDLRAACSG